MRADLHIHSTASDGLFDPARLFQMGREAGLDYMALTDHDSLAGLPLWPADNQGPRLIPGVELSCAMSQDIHILAYGADRCGPPLEAFLAQLRSQREERFREMTRRLLKQGLSINPDQIPPAAGRSVGRAHLARILFESGQAQSISQAFDRYLSPGCPAYVPRPKCSPAKVIGMLRQWGAVPALAHPGQYAFSPQSLYGLLTEWKKAGLMGLEVYHSANRPASLYADMAGELGLVITGGSDFHGLDERHGHLGSQCAPWHTLDRDLDQLLNALYRSR